MTEPDVAELRHAPFYARDGEGFVADESTRGPWSKDHQHAGPPSALLVRAAEALVPGMEVARVSCEMLRPVPLTRVTVQAEIEKAGRKASVVRARLFADDKPCLDARIGCVRVAPVGHAPLVHAPAPVPPTDLPAFQFPFFAWPVGYHTAIEGRLAHGAFGVGSMGLWMRQRGALVDGESPSGAQRALVVADAGSGVSIGLDTRQFTFVNADLSVHLHRAPRGVWILVDASTWSGGNGRGVADTALSDVDGFVGRGVQTLVIEPRA